MKSYLKVISLLAIIWLVLFQVYRLFFLLFQDSTITSTDLLQTLLHSLELDVITMLYLSFLPVFFISLFFLYSLNFFQHLTRFIFITESLLYQLIALVNVGIYYELKVKLTIPHLTHLSTPSEIYRTVSWQLLLIGVIGISLGIVFMNLLYNKILLPYIVSSPTLSSAAPTKQRKLIYLVLLSFCLFGFKGRGISEDYCYFSENILLNEASINPLWEFANHCIAFKKSQTINPYQVMNEKEMQNVIDSMYYVPKDTSIFFLKNQRPNIVFIVLESWSSLFVKSMGGEDFAKFADTLCQNGLYFSRFYANSNVSDQGIPAIFSSYPASSDASILNQISKTDKLPCLNQDLEKVGYETAFYYGGNLDFGNIKPYIVNKKFQTVIDEQQLPTNLRFKRLGIQDKDMARLFVSKTNHAKKPFFYTWYTLSSHSPYELPEPYKALVNHAENPFVNTIVYSDQALSIFFKEARKQDWYANTLFVLVADHSHPTHRPFHIQDKEYHQIPLIFYGDVLKEEFKGKNIDKVFCQTDIVPTLLKQLDLPTNSYIFGKNMMSPYTQSFAFYPFSKGCGFVSDEGAIYTARGHKASIENQANDTILSQRKMHRQMLAMRQYLNEDFIGR